MYIKYSKIVLVWSVALFATLVGFNNLTDYESNYGFVSHVLKMDTTFPDNNLMWRAIESPFIHHAAYILIISVEAIVALLCWVGGWRLLRVVKGSDNFNEAKDIAILGLTLGMPLWFTGFITVGGEWFVMWQSKIWN